MVLAGKKVVVVGGSSGIGLTRPCVPACPSRHGVKCWLRRQRPCPFGESARVKTLHNKSSHL
jgi:hypothetical protein